MNADYMSNPANTDFINTYFQKVVTTVRDENPATWNYDTQYPNFNKLTAEPMQDNNYNGGVEKVAK
jgi:hypothetical protein